MSNLQEIKNILSNRKEEIARLYRVKSLGVFGSYARGEQTISSDVDILIEFEKSPGFMKFLRLERYLSGILGVKVDMVTNKALKPVMGKQILQEVVKI
jgi:hypothetical protein